LKTFSPRNLSILKGVAELSAHAAGKVMKLRSVPATALPLRRKRYAVV